MEKTLGYIFGSLQVDEAAIGRILKDLKAQNRFNKAVVVALVAHAFCIYCAAEHCLENKKQINELKKEIEGLKKLKGE